MNQAENDGKEEHDELLFQAFPSADRVRWIAEAERALKGATPLDALRTLLPEGLAIEPIYFPEHGAELSFTEQPAGVPPFARGRLPPEKMLKERVVAPEIRAPHAAEGRARIAEEREGGATSAWIPVYGAEAAPARGEALFHDRLPLRDARDLETLLEPVDPMVFPLFLDAPWGWRCVLDRYVEAARARGVAPERLRGAVCTDPLGSLAQYGALPGSLEEAFREAGEATAWAAAEAPSVGTLWIHGELYLEAGADAKQELGFALASAVDTLRSLSERGVSPEAAAPHLRFSYGVGPRIFVEAAKLRAARLLWNRALEACGVAPEKRGAWILARTARYFMTRYHAHLNLLRAAVESFAALAGGADGVCVLPHDLLLGEPDSHARRLARNIPLILCEEARLRAVADPGGGAWFLERLTRELARAAWKEFQAVEKMGGMARALEAGYPQEAVARRAEERLAEARSQLDQLDRDLHEVEAAEDLAELEALAARVGYRSRRGTARRRAGPLRFTSADGYEILVARTAEENDELTFRIARGGDLWLHVEGYSGSHVVVRLPAGKSCPKETLLDAATLAVQYSELRRSGSGPVVYCYRKHVRKARGGRPGEVLYARSRSLRVRVEGSRLKRLMGKEGP